MKDESGMMQTPPYAAQQTTYIFPGTTWEGYEQEGTRAGENLKRGYEPLETFPAKWHNTVMNRFSIALQQAKVALDGLYDEMNSILSAAQIQPSAGQINQLLLAIQKLTELHIASATTLGGVLSNPSEAWGVEVDQSTGKMKTKTVDATTAQKGIVQLAEGLGQDTDKVPTNKTVQDAITNLSSSLSEAKISKNDLVFELRNGNELYITKKY